MVKRIISTAAAENLIQQLTAQFGPILFFQSGGCCEGSGPLCMPVNEFRPAPHDVKLGEVAGAAFYMSESHFSFSENMQTVLDAINGSGGSFSLECGTGMAFITRARLFSDEELQQLESVSRENLDQS